MTAAVVSRRVGLALAFAIVNACEDSSRPARAIAAQPNADTIKLEAPTTAPIDLGSGRYRAAPLTAMGSVAGTIGSADAAWSDTTSAVAESTAAAAQDTLTSSAPEAPDCERPAGPIPAKNNFVTSIVWIAGVKTGKSLPIEKRADLTSEKCMLDPRVQAVAVGTTMNVINDERVLHKLVFTKLGTRDTLTVTPFFNTGQIVASERIAKAPGVVEVRCARHPWTRAYIAVFDQPYFAVPGRRGNFKIDSLPPGSYTLMVWSGGDAKPVARPIQVTAGSETRVDVK